MLTANRKSGRQTQSWSEDLFFRLFYFWPAFLEINQLIINILIVIVMHYDYL